MGLAGTPMSPPEPWGEEALRLPYANFLGTTLCSQQLNTPFYVPSVSPPSQACGAEQTGSGNPHTKFLVSRLG